MSSEYSEKNINANRNANRNVRSANSMARRRKAQLRRKRKIARIMVISTSVLVVFAVLLIIKMFFIKSSPVKDLTVEAGSSIPTAEDFMENSDKKPESVKGLEDESIMTVAGDYPVTVTVDGKEWEAVLHVKDTTAPVVATKDVAVFTNAAVTPDSFIEKITDATSWETSFEKEPDVSVPGETEVIVIVTDGSGNTTKSRAKLTVNADTEAPVIDGADEIVVPVGGSVSYKKNVTVTDNSGEETELTVDSGNADISTVGRYEVTYSATDKSGNTSKRTVALVVTEADAPTEDMVNALADNILAEITNDSMTQKEKAEKIYWWVHDSITFVDTAPKENRVAGAYRGLKERRGDCYTYAMTAKILLTRAGIKNMDIAKIPDRQSHYWNLIDVGEGWYHFDTTRRKDGTTFFYWTTEQILKYSKANYNSHNYDPSQYPEIN